MPRTDAAGKVAVMLGGSGGLGLGMARRFAQDGARVVLSDINAEELAAAAHSLEADGYNITTFQADVSRSEQVDALASHVVDQHGRVDVVCNTVGVYSQGAAWELPLADWQWQMDVNFWGVLHSIRAFVPLMVKQGAGHIVNTASSITLTSRADFAAYDVSKHAVLSMCETLQHDLRATGSAVRVSVMFPGAIRSRMYDGGRNRPTQYGPNALSDDEREDMRRHLEQNGADPDVLAAILVEQLDHGKFYVFGRRGDLAYAEGSLDDVRSGSLSASAFQRLAGPGARRSSTTNSNESQRNPQ